MTTMLFNRLAVQEFERALRKAFWRNLLSRLTRKCNKLLSFDQIRQQLPLNGQSYRGLRAVPLDQIVGSEGRYRDFDRAFFPRQTHIQGRWINIAKARYEQVPLPPVELYKIGGAYFVRDGNHRVSAARALGQAFIDAHIIELEVSMSAELSNK